MEGRKNPPQAVHLELSSQQTTCNKSLAELFKTRLTLILG